MGTRIKSIKLPPLLKLLRMHQWIKSGFIAAPLFFTPSAVNPQTVTLAALGILAWSLMASAIYILNDWRDVDSDRKHPTKCNRPLAAGTVSLKLAFAVMIALFSCGFGLALYLSPGFASFMAVYGVINLAYSLRLKHIAVIDVMCIAMGFVLRVEAGAVLVGVQTSAWIVILSGLLALFLGFAKRRDDIVKMLNSEHRKSLDGYSRSFIDTVMAITLGGTGELSHLHHRPGSNGPSAYGQALLHCAFCDLWHAALSAGDYGQGALGLAHLGHPY